MITGSLRELGSRRSRDGQLWQDRIPLIRSNSKIESLSCALARASTQEGCAKKRRNLSLRRTSRSRPNEASPFTVQQCEHLETKVCGASDELAAQYPYRNSGLNLACRRNQPFLASGGCIELPALGLRRTIWRLGLEQTCRPIQRTDSRHSRGGIGQSVWISIWLSRPQIRLLCLSLSLLPRDLREWAWLFRAIKRSHTNQKKALRSQIQWAHFVSHKGTSGGSTGGTA